MATFASNFQRRASPWNQGIPIRALQEDHARLAEGAGCSLLEHDLLAWLAAAPRKRLRMLDLATRLRVTAGGLTRIIDRLVKRGWIERDRPVENRREVYATLTSAGTAALRTARVVYARVIEETFTRHLEEQDLLTLGRIAHKLLDRPGSGQTCECRPAPG